MHRKLRLTSFVLACVAVGAVMACEANQEAVATRVATDWVTDNVDPVSEEFARLVIGDYPILTQVAGDVLADRIQDSVTWAYGEPECEPDGRCRLIATASVTIDVSVPLLGDRRYAASMPFSLLVDTDAESVLRWSPQPQDASVEERER